MVRDGRRIITALDEEAERKSASLEPCSLVYGQNQGRPGSNTIAAF